MKSPFTLLTKCRWLCLLMTLLAWTSHAQTLERVTDQAPGASGLYPWGDKVFFQASTAEVEPEYFDNETWISDGTGSGSHVLKPGWIQNFQTSRITTGNGFLFYSVDWYDPEDATFTQHSVLAKSNGTTAGTQQIYLEDAVTLPAPFTDDHLGPANNLVSLGNMFLFTVNASITGTVNSYFDELWKSDGTLAGTVRVKDIDPSDPQDNISDLIVVGNSLFFLADDGVHGKELWKSDGTEAGTMMVKDMTPGSTSSNLVTLTNVEGTLYFAYHKSGEDYSVWKSDGSEAGTQMIKGGFTSTNSLSILGSLGNTVYFTGHDGSLRKLWKTDGTPAGTASIFDMTSDVANFARLGGDRFIFTYNTAETGTELWISNGTSAGTHLLADINPGAESSSFAALDNIPLKSAGDEVYFQIKNSLTGANELWKTDGTAAGTVLVYADGNVEEFIVAGNNLYASVVDFDSGIKYLHTLYFGPEKRAQTITFPPLPAKAVGQVDFDARATASSGLPVVYTSSDEAVATIVNGKIHIVGEGTVIITASQPGNDSYEAAIPVEQPLTVYPAGTNLSVVTLSGDLQFGDVIAGLSSQKELTISNTGSTELTITDITFPEGFTGGPTQKVLAPEESFVVAIIFSPTKAGAYNGEIAVISNASSGDNTVVTTGTSMLITGREENVDVNTKIYPNPGEGLYALEIAGSPQGLLLTDELGRERTPVQLMPAGNNRYQLDIRHLDAGVYIIKLKLRDTVVVKRIVKTN